MRAAECDLPVVGGPDGTPDRVDAREVDSPPHRRARHVDHVHHVLALALCSECQHVSAVRERALRIKQSELLEVRIRRALYQPLDALACASIGQPEVDEKLGSLLVSVGEKCDQVAVR